MKILVSSIFILLLATVLISAATLTVPDQYESINLAISDAFENDTVLVAPGIYYEHLDFNGKDIVLASHFVLDSNWGYISSTIIDGSNKSNTDSGTVVVFQNNESPKCVLIGFTICHGFGTLIGSSYIAGGILCLNNSNPTISHNIIKDNNSIDGGGCAFFDSHPVFKHNTVINNNAVTGGGISLDNSRTEINQNIFAYNTASEKGGAMHIYLCDGTIVKNSVFYKNSSTLAGAISCFFAFPDISYNLFFDNNNGDFWDCDEGLGDTSTFMNFNLMPSDFKYNIFCDPLFKDAVKGDFELAYNSPLVDAGSESNPLFPWNGLRTDIGLTEFEYLVGDCNRDRRFEVSDVIWLLNWIFLEGPPPVPVYSGDFNCVDRISNIVDAARMVNYIFNHGPGPCQE
jgi:hypothetical protein